MVAIEELLTYVSRIELNKEYKNWGLGSIQGYLLITTDDGDMSDSTFILTFPAFSISAAIGETEGRAYYYDSTINDVESQMSLEKIIEQFVAADKAQCHSLGRE